MRLIILTHYYPPEPGAPQVRLSALAHALAARGASVTVHTCFPHYPEGRIQPPYANRPCPLCQRHVRQLPPLDY